MSMTCQRCNSRPSGLIVDDLDLEWWWCDPCSDYSVNSDNLETAARLLNDPDYSLSYSPTGDGLVRRTDR